MITRKFFAFLFLFIFFPVNFLLATSAEKEEPSEAKVGLYIMSLYDFSSPESCYSADMWIWYDYAKNIPYNPLASREMVNAKTVNQLMSDKVFSEDGKTVWATEKIRGTFIHDWNISNFPFDRQSLKIVLEEAIAETADFVYVPDIEGSKMSNEISLDGWKISDFNLSVDERLYDTSFGNPDSNETSSYTRLVATITITREALMLFLKLHMGLYVAFAITILSFFMNTASDDVFSGRVGVLVGMLFAGVVNLQLVESAIGSSQNMTLVDRIHIMTFLLIFVSLILTIIARRLSVHDMEARALRLDRFCMIFLSLFYVITNTLMIRLAHLG